MINETLLIELFTEELPPRALTALSEAFTANVFAALKAQDFTTEESQPISFATPRRLAVSISAVLAQQPNRFIEKKGPALVNALDADGLPNQALQGFMRSMGVSFNELARTSDGKAEYFIARVQKQGEPLDHHLAAIVAQALKKLPIPKLMRWGDSDYQFVRPVHRLTMLHGARVIPGEVLGLTSGRITAGHRFLCKDNIAINHASFYEDALLTHGKVVASFEKRRQIITTALDNEAAKLQATINPSGDLIDEVTALVEWPAVYAGEFEPEYLEVPQECLILTMQQNQKYFPLLDRQRKLMNKFLIVSNMEIDNPRFIIDGNQRVVRPRLSDARFFYTQDRKTTLESRMSRFANIVYHNKLGTQAARIERLCALTNYIAGQLQADSTLAARAARLAKADLLTDMVGEFPELQGIMGRYYALAEGENAIVADAIAAHYQPRFAGDELPESSIACAIALADRIDSLTGLFGIRVVPTGDKDPYGLRRAALAVIRILCEKALPLDLSQLIETGFRTFPLKLLEQKQIPVLLDFIYDRLRGYLRDTGHAQATVEAVVAQRPTRFDVIPAKLAAVRAFSVLPEAESLAAANKRISNILKKANETPKTPQDSLLREDAEKTLFNDLRALAPQIAAFVAAQDYGAALTALAAIRPAVDRFFDEVMVMTDNAEVRANRLGLLAALAQQLNAVADISRLGNL